MSTERPGYSREARGPLIEVAAVAIDDGAGRILVANRPEGTHLAGFFELPGGKVREGETPEAAAVREAREEVGVEVVLGPRVVPPVEHAYPDRIVRLHFFAARLAPESPAPRAIGAAAVRWVERARLAELEFPPANAGVIAVLAAVTPSS